MTYRKTCGKFLSSNGKDNITYYLFEPSNLPIKAIVQISHGMCEYIERYEHFINTLTEHGFAVCGNDHLGHGKSIADDAELGYFAQNNGWQYLFQDLHKMTEIAKQQWGNLPYFLFGHSMGSFVARLYLAQYPQKLTGAVICGTSGKVSATSVCIISAKIIAKLKGNHHRSQMLNKLAFGSYNKKIAAPNTRFDWLSTRTDIVNKYQQDKYCNFLFTASAFSDLFTLLQEASKSEWFKTIPNNLPLYLIAGDADPVGQYGNGVKQVYNRLLKSGVKHVDMKLYKAARHEILNEKCFAEVESDIIFWLNNLLK